MLSLRAQANRRCRAVIFRAEVDEADAAVIKWLLDAKRHNAALIKLKECAKKVEVEKGCKKHGREHIDVLKSQSRSLRDSHLDGMQLVMCHNQLFVPFYRPDKSDISR